MALTLHFQVCACFRGFFDIVQLLVDARADIAAANDVGDNAYDLAAESFQFPTCFYLEARAAEIYCRITPFQPYRLCTNSFRT